MKFFDGRHPGKFKNRDFHGKVQYTFNDGDKYIGDFDSENFKKAGKIFLLAKRDSHGDVYDCAFENDLTKGVGIYFSENDKNTMAVLRWSVSRCGR